MRSLAERIALSIEEDLGPGDLTTEATIPASGVLAARIVAKQDLVVSGLGAAKLAFEEAGRRYGRFVACTTLVAEGSAVPQGTEIARVHGDARSVLVGERTALNVLMRMCGVATHVRRIVEAVGPATFRLVDTRKTTPLWRDLEKAAVRHGGAANHRWGLFDGVLIKDNHIAAVGSVGEAVARVKERVHQLVKIEVEITEVHQIAEAVRAGADGLLLDNMDDATLTEAIAVARAQGRDVFLEASGNMTLERLRRIAALGLDVVSMGGLIHQATWADLSLQVVGGVAEAAPVPGA